MKSIYILFKYDEDQLDEIDQFANREAAIEHAKALHNPGWPAWQGINVWCDGRTIFDSQTWKQHVHQSEQK